MKRRASRHGFTIVELLVVISITALLLAILIPVMGRAREVARRAICQSNLRQWYVVLETYANDSHGYYPGILGMGQEWYAQDSSYTGRYGGGWQPWMSDMQHDITQRLNKKLTNCPSQTPYQPPTGWWTSWRQLPEWTSTGGMVDSWGWTDYNIKCGFGSNHDGFDTTTSPVSYTPDGQLYGTIRGMYSDWKFPRRAQGFSFNYRQEQPNVFGRPISPNSIMVMDASRRPTAESQDNNPGEKFPASNHPMVDGIGADVTNIVTKQGQVRMMIMNTVWGKPDPGVNWYGQSGYAEGSYSNYADDQLMNEWQQGYLGAP